ncbi:MAG: helix-turn-helix transcriptional regulator [Sideroxyarcus sp.]|nr:helix-turn-helix transcriptional regulator [Sideroxyarcus sp.]
MANIATVLKEEVIRLARKEVRSELAGLKKASVQYRSDIAALKRRVATLEQQLSRLGKATTQNVEVKAESDSETKVRFVAKGFKSLRQRLGLTAEVMGALLDVSAQSIYSWESGKSSPRKQQLPKIAMLRGMSKREVSAILEKLAG